MISNERFSRIVVVAQQPSAETAKHGVLLRGDQQRSGSCLRFYSDLIKLPHFKNIINLQYIFNNLRLFSFSTGLSPLNIRALIKIRNENEKLYGISRW